MHKSSNKGFYLQFNEGSLFAAKTSRLQPPFVIEALGSHAFSSVEEAREWVRVFMSLKRGHMCSSVCSILPASRFILRVSLENPAKAKSPEFFPEFLKKQHDIDVEFNSVAVINANDGSEFSVEKGFSRDLVFCGGKTQEIQDLQNQLVDMSVYPERMELLTVSLLGGLCDYSSFTDSKDPSLLIEIAPTSSNVLVVHDGKVDLARSIPHGLNSMYPIMQKELGLKDEASVHKLFTSNTFDFTEMGSVLLGKLLKEIQASAGYYEVQTGQTINHVYIGSLPQNLHWIPDTLAKTLGFKVFKPDFEKWLEHQSIEVSSTIDLSQFGSEWFGLFSLMGTYS